jgi:small-conductance mechanosensitive channel
MVPPYLPRRIALLLVLLVGAISACLAQTPPAATIEAGSREIEAIEHAIVQPDVTDATLSGLRARLDQIRGELGDVAGGLTAKREAADKRLAELGPVPATDAPPEAPEIAAERQAQTTARQAVEAEEKQARVLLVRVDQASEAITRARRTLFTARIFDRSRSILDPVLWMEASDGLRRANGSARYYGSEIADTYGRSSAAEWALVVGSILLAVLIVWPLRRLVEYLAFRLVQWRIADGRFRRSALAFAEAVTKAAAPVLAAIVVGLALEAAGPLPGVFGPVAVRLLLAIAFVSGVYGLAQGILSPERPGLRLVAVDDDTARALARHSVAVAAVYATGKFLEAINTLLAVPLATTILASALFAVATSLVITATLKAARPRTGDDAAGQQFTRGLLRSAAWLVVAAVLVAVATGYVKLASFLVDQLVWAAVVGGVLLILLDLVDDALMAWARPAGLFGRFATGTVGVGGTALERIAVVVSGLLRAMLIVVAVMLVLAPWGVQSTDLFSSLRAAIVGFSVAGVTISFGDILLAVLVFLLGYAATRTIQRWLDNRFLPKTNLDTGLKSSIGTGTYYIGIILAGLAALSFLGFGLERITIVAGALSLGIGFGLQSIVSNFVSGIILLAERPIKPGDWVAIGADEGNVQRISVRATEIALFDGSTLVVPNADFISKPVRNITLRNVHGRVKLDFGAAHGTDPDRVRDLTLAAAEAHRDVLKLPAPTVQLTGFRDVGMNFSLICFVHSPRAVAPVRSDLAYAVVRAMQGAGLEMR